MSTPMIKWYIFEKVKLIYRNWHQG